MKRHLSIDIPIFEIGPKLYLYGDAAVEMAVYADTLVERYDVQIIFTAQYLDIPAISRSTANLYLFAQHVDCVRPGRGVGAVLPEALVAAGAQGAMLNHAEKKMTLNELYRAIQRCGEVGLISLVCADTVAESIAVAHLGADMILKESEGMIGIRGATRQDAASIPNEDAQIHLHKPDAVILHGAGIKNDGDVYDIIRAGATATGATSAIFEADDPLAALERSIAAVRRAWDNRGAKE